ncbi:hypothetical protein [Actinomyces sp. oral taxon 171]|uniref:hypothetical protein n=1 Tax=Actinomyces sp. oral taxon 171 TaxID=706438 RepID=UPI0001F61A49|nr:hypothetical protein [Actinomyces sp. oral taxon 171]EFW27995.1 hypothetical protein HMPREF9057_00604 [Actinomyces sp. oral taxon 171 str. F0337]
MAIYIRTRPTTKTKVLGCLCALAAAGIALLYPTALLLDPSIPNPLGEPIVNDAGNLEEQSLSILIGVMTIYSFMLIAMIFGALSGFKGTDRWLPKDATMTHRDIASARFLHISQSPARRAVGMLWTVLAVILIEVNPVITTGIPHLLIYNESAPELEQAAVMGMAFLVIGLIAALVWAASRRETIAVCMTPQGMAAVKPFPLALPLPSGRNNLSIQEVPARWGRVKVQAAYAPPTGGTEPGRPVLLSQLSLTARPSRLDDARAQVEARLDEVWRAAQLVRPPPEPEGAATAPTSAEKKCPHR